MGVLEDKIAIVTGAGQGIGKATALRLAGEGASVVIAEYDPQTAQIAAEEIGGLGQPALAYPVDVSKPDDTRKMVQDIVSEFGRVDILVSNAGISEVRPFLDMTEDA